MPKTKLRSCRSAQLQSGCQDLVELVEEMPMRRHTNPIPIQAAPCFRRDAGCAAALSQLQEELARQSQLLTDLLGAVNSLTAALLSEVSSRRGGQ